MNVEVTSNIDEVMKQKRKMLEEEMLAATRATAEAIQRDAQRLVPKLSGDLMSSIQVERDATETGHRVVAGGHTRKNVAIWQEFGWTKRDGERHYPTPWFRPAAYANVGHFKNLVFKGLNQVVK